MNKEKLIKEYQECLMDNPSKMRTQIRKLDYSNDHRLLQIIAQLYYDEAMFMPNGDQRDNIDGRKLRYADNYILRAFKIKYTCSNVLWTLAKIKTAYGQDEAAIYSYRDIIELGTKRISHDSCKNNLETIKAQINDSKFELYRLYYGKNNSLSKRYLTLYKKGLADGIYTLYKPLEEFMLPAFDKK